MSYTEDQLEKEVSPIQHEMMMSALSPEEQHELKLIRERATVDQEKSIKLMFMEVRTLFNEVASDPLLRTTGIMARLKTEAHAKIVFHILDNPSFKASSQDIVETVKMEDWAKKA